MSARREWSGSQTGDSETLPYCHPNLALAFADLRPIGCPGSLSLELTALGRKSQHKDLRRDKEEGLRRATACPFDGANVRSFLSITMAGQGCSALLVGMDWE